MHTGTDFAEAVAMNPSQPLALRDRDPTLDALRGFALFGILVMNMPSFSYTNWSHLRIEQIWPGRWDQAELSVARYLFAGKFNSLFSFLFGIGFTLQLERILRSGGNGVATYLRRVAALAVFGILHHVLLWTGDILLSYAEIGLLLLVFRRASDRGLLIGSILALLAGPLSFTIRLAFFRHGIDAKIQEWAAIERVAHEAYVHGSYFDVTRIRFADLLRDYESGWSIPWRGQMLGTTLLGCYAGRRRYWEHLSQHRRLFVRIACVAAVVALSVDVGWHFLRPLTVPNKPTIAGLAISFLFSVQRPALMLVYACIFGLVMSVPHLRARLMPLTVTGRMPLTNYLTQSVLCTLLFYGYGFGLFGKVRPALGFLLAIVIYGSQVVVSNLYLSRFGRGPMESLWRRLTYGKDRRSPATAEPRVAVQ
jgi:uncharacterized protein